jgi:uncharacterized protein (DUF952 family)
MRWLYHLVLRDDDRGDPYAPPSLSTEGFIHCSFRPAVVESARLYFPPGAALRVLQIDPRRLDVPVEIADTPRGPMPHVMGPLPRAAVAATLELAQLEDAPDDLKR